MQINQPVVIVQGSLEMERQENHRSTTSRDSTDLDHLTELKIHRFRSISPFLTALAGPVGDHK